MRRFKRSVGVSVLLFLAWFAFAAYSVYDYSFVYSEQKSDVAIVLGARTKKGKPTPVFKERLEHALYLYQEGIVRNILFTGGIRPEASESESSIAKLYLLSIGVPDSVIYIEHVSQNTLGNLVNAKKEMRKHHLRSALIVSDPLHMKRAMRFAETLELEALSSPTQASMYRSWGSKSKFLISETIFLWPHILAIHVVPMIS